MSFPSLGMVAELIASKITAAPNKTITISGSASGSGTSSVPITLATVNSDVGTFDGITVTGQGLVTAAVAKANLQTTPIATSVGLTTSSTTGVMMGLASTPTSGAGNAAVITPAATGNVMVSIILTGEVATGTDYANAQLAHGTGTVPTAGHTPTGTIISGVTWGQTNAAADVPFFPVTLTGIIKGAAIGTQLWIDVVWANGVGARAITAYSISVSAFEI